LNEGITADGALAGVGTGIAIRLIAIIAFFAFVDHGIATHGEHAIGSAGIGAIRIAGGAVIALFPTLHHAIAALRALAGIGTGIDIDFVAIVTVLTSINYRIAAAGNNAC
jgi:hypothetical protein